jgi:hypothetical protein
MVNYHEGLRSVPRLVALAASALIIGCPTLHLSEERDRPLTRLDERVVKGIGLRLYAPQPVTFGPQRIVVALAVGSRIEMSKVSAVWMTYQSPSSSVEHTERMFPVVDYLDAFGAVVPFTEAGLWHVSIHVYGASPGPAMSTFGILCCGGAISRDKTHGRFMIRSHSAITVGVEHDPNYRGVLRIGR